MDGDGKGALKNYLDLSELVGAAHRRNGSMQCRTTRWKSHATPKIATVRRLLARKSTVTRRWLASGARKTQSVRWNRQRRVERGRVREKEKAAHLKKPPRHSLLQRASSAAPHLPTLLSDPNLPVLNPTSTPPDCTLRSNPKCPLLEGTPMLVEGAEGWERER
jgi:hypothetical protein